MQTRTRLRLCTRALLVVQEQAWHETALLGSNDRLIILRVCESGNANQSQMTPDATRNEFYADPTMPYLVAVRNFETSENDE